MSTSALGGLPTTEARQIVPATTSQTAGLSRSGSGASGPSPSPAEAVAAAQARNKTPDADEVRQALDEVRQAIGPVARNLLFSVDEDTGKTVIRVIDANTDEVIRQIPSEEFISISKALDKLQGLLLRQEA